MTAPHTTAPGVSPGGCHVCHVCGHQVAPKVRSASAVTLPLSRPSAGRAGAPRASPHSADSGEPQLLRRLCSREAWRFLSSGRASLSEMHKKPFSPQLVLSRFFSFAVDGEGGRCAGLRQSWGGRGPSPPRGAPRPSPAPLQTLQGGSRQGVVELWNMPTSCGAKNSTNLASWKASLLQRKRGATWSETYRIFPVTRDTAAANMSWKGSTRPR